MIKDLFENDLGIMEGTFFSELFGYEMHVWYDKEVPLEYIEKNIQYFNHLESEFVLDICTALKRYYEFYKEEYPDLCDECEEVQGDVLTGYEEDPKSILEYIHVTTYKFSKCNASDEYVPVLNLSGGCAWSGDSGVTIAAKNNQLLFVGEWSDINLWDDGAKMIFNSMFNFAKPKINNY